jgi:glucose/arabinose dehydrogenase
VLRGIQVLSSLVLAISLVGCPGGSSTSGSTMTPPPHPAFSLQLQQINVSLSFPLFLTVTPLPGDTRLFVVEKGGAIKIVDRNTGALIGSFLNVSNLLPDPLGGEQGLLGLAFDPQYVINRRFYISYTDVNGNSVIARYLVSLNNANAAELAADRILLTIPQPFTNHNGGMIAFGPLDNLLYIGIGDGGSGGDPQNNGQNIAVLLGKLLRIDVSQGILPQPPYDIPPDNPFVNNPGADEIWSIGLRNPWRYSFDRQTGDLYIADVGQGNWEEVNASTSPNAGSGINYGWRIMEGMHCYPPGSMCTSTGLTLPVVEYDHPTGCSITGGYVYRGAAVPALRGTYFYGDYCAGFVRSFRLSGGMATEQSDWMTLRPGGNITSFGEDAAGELYIMTDPPQNGLFRIVPN